MKVIPTFRVSGPVSIETRTGTQSRTRVRETLQHWAESPSDDMLQAVTTTPTPVVVRWWRMQIVAYTGCGPHGNRHFGSSGQSPLTKSGQNCVMIDGASTGRASAAWVEAQRPRELGRIPVYPGKQAPGFPGWFEFSYLVHFSPTSFLKRTKLLQKSSLFQNDRKGGFGS